MSYRLAHWIGIGICCALSGQALPAGSTTPFPVELRIERLLHELDPANLVRSGEGEYVAAPNGLQIVGCDQYPDHGNTKPEAGSQWLLTDLRAGLDTGLQCLSGLGPMGRLHPYHEYQAHRLMRLFEDREPKTLRCVKDAMFATAVATSPKGVATDDPLYRVLRQVGHPGIVIDTYRVAGILSRQYDDQTYRDFFHLAEAQIIEHRYGQPLRPANLHRYQDRASLLFHETVHWLGHEHSAIYPDVTSLYEACCFGGSDYITDPAINRAHAETACAILKDDALWSNAYHPYRQMRIWHLKGYDRFKARMRADFDP